MKRIYEFVSILLAVLVLPFIPVGFIIALIRIALEFGYSLAIRFEHYGEKKGWESKEENDEFSKHNNLSI